MISCLGGPVGFRGDSDLTVLGTTQERLDSFHEDTSRRKPGEEVSTQVA